MLKAEELERVGDHSTALQCYTHSINITQCEETKARALLKRAHCYSEIGNVKWAIANAKESSTCTHNLQSLRELAFSTLGKLYESAEMYEQSMACFQDLLKVNPNHKLAIISVPRLKRSIEVSTQYRKQASERKSEQSDLLPSIPRKVHSRFENRGKSGAVF